MRARVINSALLSLALLCVSIAFGAGEDAKPITIGAGMSVVVDTQGDVERVAVASEDVVEAVAITQREVILNGKAPGQTTVIIWQKNSARVAYSVTVEPSSAKLDALRRFIQKEVGDTVQVDFNDKSVVVSGSVKTQADGEHAMALAAMAGKPVNLLTVAPVAARPQVLLKVKFADVDRTASMSLGANLFSTNQKTTGSSTTQQFAAPTPTGPNGQAFNLSSALNLFLFRPDLNLGAAIEALESRNMLQMLAEPNLLSIAGKQASFLAGGEFPYPVVQSSAGGTNNVTIMFREFGIRLTFTPEITPQGTIRLSVEPEVSALDYANGLTYSGFTIPGLSVRRVKTEIEVADRQSFAIAGLLDNHTTQQLSKIPGLASIPLLGKLFQSRSTNRNNTELLVVVTPELVQPIPAGAEVPKIEMPMTFLPGMPAQLPGNPADPQKLPVKTQVPFVPASESPATSDAKANPIAGLAEAANAFKAGK